MIGGSSKSQPLKWRHYSPPGPHYTFNVSSLDANVMHFWQRIIDFFLDNPHCSGLLWWPVVFSCIESILHTPDSHKKKSPLPILKQLYPISYAVTGKTSLSISSTSVIISAALIRRRGADSHEIRADLVHCFHAFTWSETSRQLSTWKEAKECDSL